MAEDRYVLRRQFSKFLVLTSFGMLAGNAWIWAKSLVRRKGGASRRNGAWHLRPRCRWAA